MNPIVLPLAGLLFAGTVAASEAPSISPGLFVGGDVRITEAVEGPLRAAGGSVKLTAPVDGDAYIAGGSVTVDGSINGNLHVAGGEVRIDGPVTGDASVAAGTLELGPSARIDGKLVFHGEDLRQAPGSQVASGIERDHASRWSVHHQRTAVERFMHGWVWSIGLMVLAALIAAALPGASQRMAEQLRERPWITPLVGLLALTSIPIAAVLVMITIIGIPIGLLALIGYVALLLLGYVWVAVVVGGMLLDRVKPQTVSNTAWHAGAAMLAMLVLAILVRVPFVGGLVKLTALVMGVGMIVSAIFRHTHPSEPVAAA